MSGWELGPQAGDSGGRSAALAGRPARVLSRKKNHPAQQTHRMITETHFLVYTTLIVLVTFELAPSPEKAVNKASVLSFSFCKTLLQTSRMDTFSHVSQFTYNNFTESTCFLLMILIRVNSLIHGKMTLNSKA